MTADQAGVDHVQRILGDVYDFSVTGAMAPDPTDARKAVFLNRVIRFIT